MEIKVDYSMMIPAIPRRVVESYKKRIQFVHEVLTGSRKKGVLPFYELPYQDMNDIHEFVKSVEGSYRNIVVLGIGGSALGLIALNSALRSPYREFEEEPHLYVLDNIDPERFKAVLDNIKAKETLVNVITKSGTTAETMASFLIFKDWMEREIGEEEAKKRIILTTDTNRGTLRQIANESGYKSFAIPDGVGGRFSVLTPVGLLPAALAGMEIEGLLDGAAEMDRNLTSGNLFENAAYMGACLHHAGYLSGRHISVMFSYSDRLFDLADWYRQLWAESLGKRVDIDGVEISVGATPVKARGVTDQHSQVQLYKEGPDDKLYTFLKVEHPKNDIVIPGLYNEKESISYLGGHTLKELFAAEERATEVALAKEGRPVSSIIFDSVTPRSVGEFFYLMEVMTVAAGMLFRIDPLNQPGVEAGKNYTYGLMGRKGYEEKKREVLEFSSGDKSLIFE